MRGKTLKIKKTGQMSGAKLCVSAIFIVLVIIPLIRMFANMDGESFAKVVASDSFLTAAKNSVVVSLISTLISVLIAFLLAWCIERTRIRFKGIFSIILVLPMLIPSISHGMGLIILLGTNGVVTNLLGLSSNIYGMWGIVTGSVIYSFPVAFLMLSDVMRYEDSSPYEAAEVMGIPKWRQLLSISLPYLTKPLISTVFAVFTMIVTDYGVPLMVGGKFTTLPVVMYQEVIGQLNFSKGSIIGAFLLIPAVIAFVFDMLKKDDSKLSYVTKKFDLKKNTTRDVLAYLICGLVSVFTFILLFSFAILTFTTKYPSNLAFTFDNIIRTYNMSGGRYLANSFIIALLVAVIGVVISFTTAYLTARIKSNLSKILHLISITSLAVPGIVLGLSYVITFKGSFFYGTLAILIMVNIVHFFASPYLMMYNSLNKLNENLEAVGQTLGIGKMRIIWNVIIPQSKFTIAEMFSYFFVNSMMTISAVSFLATTATKPVSLMINQFEAQTMLECAAVVSLAILIINFTVKGLIYVIRRVSLYKERRIKTAL